MQSLSRKFLLGVGLTALILTALASVGGFVVFQRELAHRQVGFLAQYVRERTRNVDRRFSGLTALHRGAETELRRRMAALTPADTRRLLGLEYPLQPDGTRRSRAAAFDGETDGHGDLTYGIGAFIGHGGELTAAEARAMVAAYPLVSHFGQAAHSQYDNFYFFMPKDRLVMFGPDRPDRLMFYRHEAPADLTFRKEEMNGLVLPAADPSRATRCTTLQRLIQDNHGERLATACLTPAYVDGRYVGAFGSSIQLTGFFLDAVRDALPGATSSIVTGAGDLIASPRMARPGRASPETIAAYERALGLHAMMAGIRRSGRDVGVIVSPDRRSIVAYGRLAGPDWYLLLSYPAAAINGSAIRSASWVLLVGLAAAALQTAIIVAVARRTLVRPLQQLADSCDPDPAARPPRRLVKALRTRDDEIGRLAQALWSERDRADELLASLETRVRERTEALEHANAEKSRFLANMSHELRTPLNGVIAVSELLTDAQTTAKNRDLGQLIVASGRLLKQVLSDILDFSKIESGELELEQAPFALVAAVRCVAELHRATAEAKGLSFTWSMDEDLPPMWIGDGVRLTQVVSNLLSNAIKFTERGSVSLSVWAGAAGLVFRVTDTGIGFDAATGARLFERFEQADASINRRFGGTGLGLAISRSLVERMGGTIGAVSALGQGATFEAVIPLQPSEQVAAPVEAPPVAPVDLAGLRVLLAEDHPTNQRVVRLILETVGVEMTVVENGALALDVLAEQAFDLVLMDMQMPVLDGLAATRAIRAREAAEGRPRTPVIMLTANALEEHVRASLDVGADRHLAKPLRPAELLSAVATEARVGPSGAFWASAKRHARVAG